MKEKNMKSVNPRIEWCLKSGKQCLRFTFGEWLSVQDGQMAIQEWREAFQVEGDRAIVLIWDCRKMKGYDSVARKKWTEALKEMKSQIEVIWLITDSTIIKMGASVMGMLSSLEIKAIRSESEVAFEAVS